MEVSLTNKRTLPGKSIAVAKNVTFEHTSTRWTSYLSGPHVIVRSAYFRDWNALRDRVSIESLPTKPRENHESNLLPDTFIQISCKLVRHLAGVDGGVREVEFHDEKRWLYGESLKVRVKVGLGATVVQRSGTRLCLITGPICPTHSLIVLSR